MSEKIPSADELLPWHKRQATLLYRYASLAYLEGLLPNDINYQVFVMTH